MKGDLRCVDGRLFRHDPQFDDPDLETDVGQCPDCSGDGCLDEFEHEGREMTAQNAFDLGYQAAGGCVIDTEMLTPEKFSKVLNESEDLEQARNTILKCAAERDALRAQVEMLREALRPFSAGATNYAYATDVNDDALCAAVSFTAGEYRRARSALAATETKDKQP